MTSRQYLIYAAFLVGLIALCAALWYSFNRQTPVTDETAIAEPLDVLFDFYNTWLEAAQASTTIDANTTLLSHASLATSTRDSLKAKLTDGTDGTDPVLCQLVTPERIKVKTIHELPTDMEVMVISRYASSTPTGFALVKMTLENRDWRITNITCSRGDVLDEREFSFEQSGQLLKNVPSPLDNTVWHLVFTENGTPGHVAALSFGPNSRCIAGAGEETICDPNTFNDADYATVQGTMTETGVDVRRLTLTVPD